MVDSRRQQSYATIDPFSVASTAASVPGVGRMRNAVGAGDRLASGIANRSAPFLQRAGQLISRVPGGARVVAAAPALGRGLMRYGGPALAVGMAGLDAYNNRDNPDYDIGGQLAGNALGMGLGLASAPITGPFAPIVGGVLSSALGNIGSNFNITPDSEEVKVARANQELDRTLQNISDPVIAGELVQQNRNQLREDLGLPQTANTGFDGSGNGALGDTLTDLPDSVTDFRPMTGAEMLNEMYNPNSQTFQGRRMLEDMARNDARLLNRDQHQMGMQKLGMELQSQQAANALQGYLADTDSYRNFLGGFVNRINY
jgi:hypothetical protein